LISKAWKAADGLTALPDSVRRMVEEVLRRMKVAEDQQYRFFDRRFSISQREALAYELSHSGLGYRDIAVLLGVTVMAAHTILERVKQQVADGLPPRWLPANFVDDVRFLKEDAQWCRSKSESAMTDQDAAMFRRAAITATGRSGDLLVKVAQTDAIAKALKDAAAGQGGTGDKPAPTDRVGTLQWVFENVILKQTALEAPKEDDAAS